MCLLQVLEGVDREEELGYTEEEHDGEEREDSVRGLLIGTSGMRGIVVVAAACVMGARGSTKHIGGRFLESAVEVKV